MRAVSSEERPWRSARRPAPPRLVQIDTNGPATHPRRFSYTTPELLRKIDPSIGASD
jgi:hypothetical protein